MGQHQRLQRAEGLYVDSSLSTTPVDYIEAPLIYAQALLCHLTGQAAECERAASAAERRAAALRLPARLLASVRRDLPAWMLALYSLEGDTTLYLLAADNARDARTRAATAKGCTCSPGTAQRCPRRTRSRACCRRRPRPRACSLGWRSIRRLRKRARTPSARHRRSTRSDVANVSRLTPRLADA